MRLNDCKRWGLVLLICTMPTHVFAQEFVNQAAQVYPQQQIVASTDENIHGTSGKSIIGTDVGMCISGGAWNFAGHVVVDDVRMHE